ncbi:MAG: hypothetical protein R3A10_07720 [Caldilineaceae bacterium]
MTLSASCHFTAPGHPRKWIVNLNADCIDRHITPTSHGYRLRERLVPPITSGPARRSFAVADILGTDAADNQ